MAQKTAAKLPTKTTKAKKPFFLRMSIEEQMLFAKRLAVMLKAGVPIVQSLGMIQRQTKSKSSKIILADLIVGVENGQFLYSQMEKHRKIFGDFAVNIVRVGEVSGTLHENLGYLAEELRKKKDLRRKIVSALVYPCIIIVATVGIAVLLISYVFPKILPVLQSFHGQLPLTTRTLIWLSHIMTTEGWLIFLIIGILVAAWIVLLKRVRAFRLFVDGMIIQIPVLGTLFKYYHMSNFCRTLGILLRSDVRIVEATKITARTSTNLAYRDSLDSLSDLLLKGEKLSTFLEMNTRLFPEIIGQMVSVGESTGKLTESLQYLADIYEAEVDELAKNLSTAIEPALMIFMGLLVGFIAMSIITPIYALTQSLSIH